MVGLSVTRASISSDMYRRATAYCLEHADDVGASFHFAVHPLQRVGRGDLGPVLSGNDM